MVALEQQSEQPAIRVSGLRTQFGRQIVHDDLDLEVRRGEVIGIVGGSGTGKSVLLRTIIGLNPHTAGRIELLGQDMDAADDAAQLRVKSHTGVLFQDGALFSSLTVAENIQVPLAEHVTMPASLMFEIAEVKISMVGLPPDAANKYPSELSGGMRKRAGLARALAREPEILFLDEPTAGLDPIGAHDFDTLIGDLQRTLGLTVVMITHDLDSLYAICDRVAVLLDKRVKVGTIDSLSSEPDPWIRDYFHGPRARAAQHGSTTHQQPE